jgi:hypothetical protein
MRGLGWQSGSLSLDFNYFFNNYEDQKMLELPANTSLEIKDFDPILAEDLYSAATKEERLEKLLSIFDNLLFFIGQRIKVFSTDGQISIKNQPFAISSSKNILLKLTDQGDFLISARYMITQMKRQGLAQLEIKPSQRLFFYDISQEEIENIINDTKNFYKWLSSKILFDGKVYIEGSVTLERGTFERSHST